MSCPGSCRFPGWASSCPGRCPLPQGHFDTCVCPRHLQDPWATVRSTSEGPVPSSMRPVNARKGSFAELIQYVCDHGLAERTLEFQRRGIRTVPDMLKFLQASAPPTLVNSNSRPPKAPRVIPAGGEQPSPNWDSVQSRNTRSDHPVLDFTRGGNSQDTLATITSQHGREAVLRLADERVFANSSKENHTTLWNTW